MRMSQLNNEERLKRMFAEFEIRELTARFSDAVTRGDVKAFQALWTDDVVWEIHEPHASRAEGLPAIVSMLQELAQPWAFFVQLTHSGIVEFETSSSAVARWVMREVARSVDGRRSYDNLALYEDRVVSVSDGS
jgi:ketosteroid isomerase-like protein